MNTCLSTLLLDLTDFLLTTAVLTIAGATGAATLWLARHVYTFITFINACRDI